MINQKTKPNTYIFQTEIKSMLYAFGDTKNPNIKTMQYLENLTRVQIKKLFMLATKIKNIKRARMITIEDICFVLRHNRLKVKRIISSVTFKELRKKINEEDGEDIEIDYDETKFDWLVELNKRIIIRKRESVNEKKVDFVDENGVCNNEHENDQIIDSQERSIKIDFVDENGVCNNEHENDQIIDSQERSIKIDFVDENGVCNNEHKNDQIIDSQERSKKIDSSTENMSNNIKINYNEIKDSNVKSMLSIKDDDVRINNIKENQKYEGKNIEDIVNKEQKQKKRKVMKNRHEKKNHIHNDIVTVETPEEKDEGFKERLKKIDDITKKMNVQEYLEYSECRQASFTYRKNKKFKDFLEINEKIKDDVIEILGFIAYEMLYEIVDEALTIKQENDKPLVENNFFFDVFAEKSLEVSDIEESCRRILRKKKYLFL